MATPHSRHREALHHAHVHPATTIHVYTSYIGWTFTGCAASLALMVFQSTIRTRACKLAAYVMNSERARLFPMIARVNANTPRSSGFNAWMARSDSCQSQHGSTLMSRSALLTLPLNASNGFRLSSYLSLYRPMSSSRLLIAPFNMPAVPEPLGVLAPGVESR